MKSLVTLHLAVLRDAGRFCDVNVQRDSETLIARHEHEGDSFLTITLPSFAKSLEKGLAEGSWPHQTDTAFRSRRGLPVFLRGFLMRVFADDGGILDEPDANAIWAVRQICNLTAKVERDCTPERVKAAFDTYIRTDKELGDHFERGIPASLWERFSRVAHHLFGDLFDRLETSVANFDLIPRHGPGAVADRLDHPQRWDFAYWPERLEGVFPFWRYTRNLPCMPDRDLVPIEEELPSRVVSVPKTQKTPRIIAIEPSSIQYAQQGLKREMYSGVNKSALGRLIGFTDQERNQQLALRGSIDGSLATLDLSEASDRVHHLLVKHLLAKWPHLSDYVFSTRSLAADVQGEVIRLEKFASMGSALTFPIEAFVFLTVAAMGTWTDRLPPVPAMAGTISVYGDDIIVPVDKAADVVHYLEAFGFRVNMHKSFWSGRFRESCGKEYYAGTDVSVVRLRSEVPTSRQDAALVNQFTDFRNRAYAAGLWSTVKECDETLDGIIVLPPSQIHENEQSSGNFLRKDTFLRTKWRGSYDPYYQNWFERFPAVVSKPKTYKVDGEGGLVKWFYENHERSVQYQTDRYESQERAHTFRYKWVKVELAV